MNQNNNVKFFSAPVAAQQQKKKYEPKQWLVSTEESVFHSNETVFITEVLPGTLRNAHNVFEVPDDNPLLSIASMVLIVAVLHSGLMFWVSSPVDTKTKAKPLPMEVMLLQTAAEGVEEKKPPPQVSPPSKVQPKPIVKPLLKPKPKPAPKKLTPPKKIAPKLAPEVQQVPTVDVHPLTSKAPAEAASSGVYTKPKLHANYAHNPAPQYPEEARERHYEGKVLLRVNVSAQGTSLQVNVHRSSGYTMLDDAAVKAVKHWEFIPATRGETPVPGTVVVPIKFLLEE